MKTIGGTVITLVLFTFLFLIITAADLFAYTKSDIIKIVDIIGNSLHAEKYIELVKHGIIPAESSYMVSVHRYEKSSKDLSIGLCGMTFKTARKELYWKGTWLELYEPEINIRLCFQYLLLLDSRYKGDFKQVIMHYNGSEKYYYRVIKLMEGEIK